MPAEQTSIYMTDELIKDLEQMNIDGTMPKTIGGTALEGVIDSSDRPASQDEYDQAA